jgi:farnesyl diphosphate synthase
MQENVSMVAINDCFMLQSMLFQILKFYFKDQPSRHLALLDLFLDIKMKTELGQLIDLLTAPAEGPRDLTRFDDEIYRKIVVFKTAHYSFCLPVISSLIAV